MEKGLPSKNNLQLDCRPNPGEVEWDLADLWADRDLEGKTNIRHLDFSAKLAVSAEGDVPTEVGVYNPAIVRVVDTSVVHSRVLGS